MFCYVQTKRGVDPLLEMHAMNSAIEERTKKAFKAMNLDDRDVDKFYNLYRKIDKDNGGYIDIQNFIDILILIVVLSQIEYFRSWMEMDRRIGLPGVRCLYWNFCSLNRGGLILLLLLCIVTIAEN